MNESVQIKNKSGEAMSVEGIAYIQLTATGKKYLFYTLNEKVDNDLTKIYIAEVSDQEGFDSTISDAEWDDLRKRMVKISHKEELADINYISMANQSFNIGEPKKLAISAVNKQAFKDAQMTHTIATNQSDTPIVQGTSTFFTADAETPQAEEQASTGDSIFANPPQPVETNVENATPVEATPATPVAAPVEQPVQTVAQEPVVAPVTPVEAPAIGPTEPAVPVVEPQPAVVSQPVQEVVPAAPVEVTPVENVPLITQTDTPATSGDKPIISDEEALKAISVIQNYIDQEESAAA